MKTKRIKVTKEYVNKEALELKEEDLEKIAGGELGVNERYSTDEEYRTGGGYMFGGYRTCGECGREIKSIESYRVKGFCCPYCGYFNS